MFLEIILAVLVGAITARLLGLAAAWAWNRWLGGVLLARLVKPRRPIPAWWYLLHAIATGRDARR